MTDLPAIDTMTAEAVRRELFSLLGGTLSIGEGDQLIVQWNGVITQTTMYAAVDPLDLAGVPDWPHDSAVALALCLKIAEERSDKSVKLDWEDLARHIPKWDYSDFRDWHIACHTEPSTGKIEAFFFEVHTTWEETMDDCYTGTDFQIFLRATADTPAFALSRLALAALRGTDAR